MCPKKFEYIYIDKIRPETSEAAQRGIEVHEFCNLFYDNITFVDEEFVVNPNFLDKWYTESLPESVEMFKTFQVFERERWQICKEMRPNDPQSLFIPLLREKKYFSDKLNQVTIIDRLDLRPDGNYTLVEIKTGRYNPKPWKLTELRRELTFEKRTAETTPEFYENFPNKIVDFVVFYPRSADILNESFNMRTQKALEKVLVRMRHDIKLGRYPCNVQYHCRFCNFPLVCSMDHERKLRVK